MKTFQPLLAPNQIVDLATLRYPLLASYKYDGIRCIFKDGQMFTRSLKSFANKNLEPTFRTIAAASQMGYILDGELYSPSISFNELSGVIRQIDGKLPDDLKFYCFEVLVDITAPFQSRLSSRDRLLREIDRGEELAVPVRNSLVSSENEVSVLFHKALAEGFEGLMLRNPEGRYKYGRATVKENISYKVKPYITFDAQIIDVVQATVVREGAEKKVNELGHQVTSKKKGDRVPIEQAADFVVKYRDGTVSVSIAMTAAEKQEVWTNRDKYIGRWIEYKGMLVGAKNAPRHPVFLRFRTDLDK